MRNKEELKAAKEKAEKDKKLANETVEKENIKQEKSEKNPPVDDTEHDGRGDRFFGGNDAREIINEEIEPGAPPMDNDSESGSLLLSAPVYDENVEPVRPFESPMVSTSRTHSNQHFSSSAVHCECTLRPGNTLLRR